MRRRLMIAALLGSTCLSPAPAHATGIEAFIAGLSAGFAGTAPLTAAGLIGSTGAFATGALIGGSVLGQLALSVGLSAIARALTPKPSIASPSDQLVNFAQPVTAMDWVFGQVRKGGPYAVTSFQEDRRHYAVILAANEITGIDQWYVDHQAVEVESDLVTTEPFTDNIGLRAYLGAPAQAADSILVDAIPEWTSAHDMAGLAYVAAFARRVKDKDFAEVYGNSPQTGPAITPVFRGVPVYDPRTETTGYSNNAALVWAWITENRLGQVVDWDAVAVEADAADVFVTNREGGTQRKWTLNGTFPDDTDYESLLQQVILACDGYIYEKPDGTVGFYVGRYIEPTITLTDEDFFGFEFAENEIGQDPATEFLGRYIEPANDWQESTSAAWVEDEESRINRQTVVMYFSNSHNQTMRALKRVAKANRAQFSVQGTIGIIALELLEHRFVNVDILGRQFVAEIGSIQGTEGDSVFEITLTSVEPEDFDFDASTEEPERPPRDEVTNDNEVPAPESLSGIAVPGPGVEWSWAAQPNELNQEFRFRKVGEFDWQPAISITDGATEIITPGLVDGESYEAELRNVTAARRPSAWVASGTVQAVANATPPAPVEDFDATVTGSDVSLTWTAANDLNHAGTRIYRSATTDFGDASLIVTEFGPPNSVGGYTDNGLSAGNYRYWAASINASGIEGSLAGPVDVTIV